MGDQAAKASHPYIPNAVPTVKAQMLAPVGVGASEDLYDVIPPPLRLGRLLDLPEALVSEYDLRRHVEGLLARNRACDELLSFLGTGCHDGSRSMLGSYQAQIEFQSMMGELVGMEMVSTTTYDWGTSAASSLIMAAQITGRREVLLPRTISPGRLRQINTICGPTLSVRLIDYERESGSLDLAALRSALSQETAAVYLEVPAYLGTLEARAPEIGDLARQKGALFIVGA